MYYCTKPYSQVAAPECTFLLPAGPLPLTVGHFWLTVWQQRSKAVLMLNRVFEKGQPKCAQYWPVAAGESMTFEDVGLKVDHVRSVLVKLRGRIRTLLLTSKDYSI